METTQKNKRIQNVLKCSSSPCLTNSNLVLTFCRTNLRDNPRNFLLYAKEKHDMCLCLHNTLWNQVNSESFDNHLTSWKKSDFATSKVKKTSNLTTVLSPGEYDTGPYVLTCRPKLFREIRIWTPFRVPGPERRVKRFQCFRLGRR